MTDPKQIAASLTKAQREWVLRCPFYSEGTGLRGSLVYMTTGNPGSRPKIFVRESIENYQGRYSLTPLGQQVRDIIKEQENG